LRREGVGSVIGGVMVAAIIIVAVWAVLLWANLPDWLMLLIGVLGSMVGCLVGMFSWFFFDMLGAD